MNLHEALLISFVTSLAGRQLNFDEIDALQYRIKSVTPEPTGVSEANLQDLLKAMLDGRKIDAIRQYRAITKVGLKEAKDGVERYWYAQPKTESKEND